MHEVQLSLRFEKEVLQEGQQAVLEMLVLMAHKHPIVHLSEVDKRLLRLHTW